jgi:hypothetical protein
MDTKAILNSRKKLNELAIQHNKLTTLVACLFNEINALKQELQDSKGNNSGSGSSESKPKQSQGKSGNFSNFSDLRAEEILKQLSINTSIDN